MNKCPSIAFVLALLLFSHAAEARDQLRIVGSSTVFPFAAATAEQFGRSSGFRTPIVESTGTGGGLKMFCSGIGENYPDMANASRPIKDSEVALCAKNGIKTITELSIGYDGIVLANALQSPAFALTRRIVFLAMAEKIPHNGALIKNPYQRWSEIDATLPDVPITLYGRPPSSGTRDAFVELVMVEGCKEVPEMRAVIADEKTYKHQCEMLREDGPYVEAGEDNNLIVQKLVNNPQALGIFGYSYLDTNATLVKANAMDGVKPTLDAIVRGEYEIARSLFVYVKNAHIGVVPGLAEFATELTSDAATGEDGYLMLKGLLPLPQAQHQGMQERARAL